MNFLKPGQTHIVVSSIVRYLSTNYSKYRFVVDGSALGQHFCAFLASSVVSFFFFFCLATPSTSQIWSLEMILKKIFFSPPPAANRSRRHLNMCVHINCFKQDHKCRTVLASE